MEVGTQYGRRIIVLFPPSLRLPPEAVCRAFALAAFACRGAVAMLMFDVNVIGRQFVPPGAMRPGGRGLSGANGFHVLRRGNRHETTQNIHTRRDGLQVVGIDAVFHSAEVVNLQSRRDWSIGVFVRNAMGWEANAPAPGRNSAVATLVHVSVPQPTTIERVVNGPIKHLFQRCGKVLQCGHSLRSWVALWVGVRDGGGASIHLRHPVCSRGAM
jgi:hypothetical protein